MGRRCLGETGPLGRRWRHAFNFHPDRSAADLRIPLPEPSDYRVVLDSDARLYGGYGRVAEGQRFPWLNEPLYGRMQSARIYLPARAGLVLAPLSAG